MPLLLFVAMPVFADDEEIHTLPSNLKYHFAASGLPEVTFGPPGHATAQVTSGVQELWDAIQRDKDHWVHDSVMARLGHAHPFSSISFRERSDPSLHVVFFPQENGELEASAHIDLYGPENRWLHASEITRNNLTLSHTSQLDVYHGLVKRHDPAKAMSMEVVYSYNQATRDYVRGTFEVQSVALPAITSLVDVAWAGIEGQDGATYGQAFRAGMERYAVQRSVEYLGSVLLRQDTSFKPRSGNAPRGGFAKRLASATLNTFLVDGYQRREVAFPRVAAAFVTAYYDLLRWQGTPQQSSFFLAVARVEVGYFAQSLFMEFGREPLDQLWRKVRGHPTSSAFTSTN